MNWFELMATQPAFIAAGKAIPLPYPSVKAEARKAGFNVAVSKGAALLKLKILALVAEKSLTKLSALIRLKALVWSNVISPTIFRDREPFNVAVEHEIKPAPLTPNPYRTSLPGEVINELPNSCPPPAKINTLLEVTLFVTVIALVLETVAPLVMIR